MPHYLEILWDALSDRARKDCTQEAKEMVSLLLDTIAPLQGERLWQAIIQCHQSLDVGLEAVLFAYKKCENKSTDEKSKTAY